MLVVATSVVVAVSAAGAKSQPAHSFEARPVIATGVSVDQCFDQAPDDCIVAGSRDGSERYQLGPVIIDGSDVRTVRARNDRANGWLIVLDLTPPGLQAFNVAAGTQFGRAAPGDRVALVVDGVVESAPAFQSPTFEGDVAISGDFTKVEAQTAARAIRRGG